MKHIIFGGFDYAVLYEMNQDAILNGIDYFVDTDEKLIGTSYLGKPIKAIEELKEEDADNVLILIGSIVYRAEAELLLKELGFKENKNYMWAIAFNGDNECERLWRHIEWSDRENNIVNLKTVEEGEYSYVRLKMAASMLEWNKYEKVIDLGAANERLRNFIPKEIKYIPVDYLKYTDSTLVMNINKYEFPFLGAEEKQDKVCIMAIGIVQYCADWKWFLNAMTQTADCIIIGHDDFARLAREYRRTQWGRFNALFDHQIIRYMQEQGFVLRDSMDFRLKTSLYKFERKNR